jgi:hypothetical protein
MSDAPERQNPMFGSTDNSRHLLDAIVAGPIGWQTPQQLATRLGLELNQTADLIADLNAQQWLDPWETEQELYVTLSPRAAERLNVRLVQVGRSEVMRWRSWDDPELPQPRSLTRSAGRADALELIADPSPGPEAEAMAAERAERLVAIEEDPADSKWFETLPRPTILLGLGLTPWPGPRRSPEKSCPGCGSDPISETSYCLVCDRWGLDHLLARARQKGRPNSAPQRSTPTTPADAARAVSAAKAARKARRQCKWGARVELEKSRKSNPSVNPRTLSRRPCKTPCSQPEMISS